MLRFSNWRGSWIDHLHYDVIRAKPDGSCSRPAETGPSVSKNGGKQAGKPADQKRYWEMNEIRTTSLTVVTEENVPGASFNLKTPKLFAATSRQLEMQLAYICYPYVHFFNDECKELLDSPAVSAA